MGQMPPRQHLLPAGVPRSDGTYSPPQQQRQYYAPAPMPQHSPQYQPEPTYLQQVAHPYEQHMQHMQHMQPQQMMPPPQQMLPPRHASPPRRTTPTPTSLPTPAPLPPPGMRQQSSSSLANGGSSKSLPLAAPTLPAASPPTHYCKLSVLMLVLGGVLGYAYRSASAGPAACAAYKANSSRAAMLTSVLSSLDVSNPDKLAGQIDQWVTFQDEGGGALALGGSGGGPSVVQWLVTPSAGVERCGDGLFLSGPQPSPLNIMVYLLLLLWSFVGVAIGADVFMLAIEQITSQETTVRKVVNGQVKEFTVLVWNATIANLTLMALGSSAPEILLSVIEITSSGFYAGELGPSTIVGSAAFNLLVISAVCVTAIPKGEGRLIKDRSVFAVTATFSVLAYVWLIVILVSISPNVVEVWEGAVTFLLFAVLIWLAYAADQGACNFGSSADTGGRVVAISKTGKALDMDEALSAYDSGLSPEEQQERLAKMLERPKTRAFYRVNAVHSMTDGMTSEKKKALSASGPAVLNFATAMLTPQAGDRHVDVVVLRSGNLGVSAAVAYRSVGAATESKGEGYITVAPMQVETSVRLPILPGEAAFYVVLVDPTQGCDIGSTWSCAVLVEKPSSPGMLKFEHERLSVKESMGKVEVAVLRVGGHAGRIKCKVRTKDQTALAGSDYEPIDRTLIFADGETRATFPIYIVDDDVYESDETFQVVLSEPEGGVTFDPTCDGGADKAVATVTIVSDEQVRRKVDELAALVNFNQDDVMVSANSWSEQFQEAFEFDADDGGFLMYLLSLPWKVIFAFTPPARMMGGWLCFFIALVFIGLLTALIGDLAAHMGCCMGIAPAITAITFVALGTSLPDTFASRTAAQSEPYADSSIGNITGSNSVNVFLGLGLPWMVAAFYWANIGRYTKEAEWRARYSSYDWYTPDMPVAFVVDAGDLGFSVAVFTGCALVCLATLLLRRATIGYELGGSAVTANATAVFFVLLWFFYIGASVLYSYRIGPFAGA